MVTLRLSGRGVDVTVQGPVSDLAELEAAATRLLAAAHDPRILP